MNKERKLTLRLAGPLKRTTFDPSSVNPVEESINDLLHWSWSTRVQMNRLCNTFQAELDWSEKSRLKRRRRFSATSYEEHILLVAARNLVRAMKNAPKTVKQVINTDLNYFRPLILLRDIYEHWDQLRRARRSGLAKQSLEKLIKEFPEADPWSFSFDPKTGDIAICGAVSLLELQKQLRTLEARLLRFERKLKR